MQSKQDQAAQTESDLLRIEHELLRDRFIDFERGVLQDNITLCDTKAGLLLAFTGAMVVFCMDAAGSAHEPITGQASLIRVGVKVLFWVAAAGFLVSSHYSLSTVLPRIVRGGMDHIFWESPVFKLPVDQYVRVMEKLDADVERDDKLRHLHLLAGICGRKYGQFQTSMRLGRLAFLALMIGLLLRAVV